MACHAQRTIGSHIGLVIITCIWIMTLGVQSQRDPIVETAKGRVRGTRQDVLGKVVNSFLGIPFAKPPLGDLRFRHPQPPDPWTGTFNAKKLPNTCIQGEDTMFGNFSGSTMWNPNTNVSEDCLYLNVWVPITSSQTPKPVLVWIFGGGFYSGTSTLDVYDPKILAAENDIIVVSMQYRVGMLGFIAMGHPDAPGNAALFDQLMSLEWIQNNIRYFGGDPGSVTLFGESAGSVSVSLHLLSPLSRNKFHRAILQSGAATTKWGTLTTHEARSRALEVAEIMRCKSNNDAEIIRCLKTVDAMDFPRYEWVSYGIAQFPFVPVVDGAFLIETPETSMKRGNFKRCPVLLGSNYNEGSYFIIYELPNYFNIHTESLINGKEFEESIEKLFHFYPQYPHVNNRFGLDAIKHKYTDWNNPEDMAMNRYNVDQAVADYHFLCHQNYFAEAYALSGENVYYYYFTHESSQNPWPKWMGVMHGYEINYVFGEALRPHLDYTLEEKILSRKMMTYWTNFAKTGDPNRAPDQGSLNEWPLHTAMGREYLTLDIKYNNHPDKSAAIGQHLRAEYCAFWQDYMPSLVIGTADITEQERLWKIQFNDWSTKYIVDWKNQYDQFVKNSNGQCRNAKDNGN